MHSIFDPDSRPIIAHRGASGYGPENTLQAFEIALEQGADALEFDVHVTADGVPVVIHDPTIDRTTNLTGSIAGLTLEQLQEADAGARFTSDRGRTFPWRGRGVRIPTLEEVLTKFPDVPCIVEIKTARACEGVQRLLLSRRAAERCLIMSFDPEALVPFHTTPWLTGATSHEALHLLSHALLGRPFAGALYRALSVPQYYRGFPIPLRSLATAARRHNHPVHVWVVNTPMRAQRLWKKGVAGIVTNMPREILKVR